MPCPDDTTLLSMLEHSIDAVRFGELERHIDSCEICRKAVAVLALGSRSPSVPHTPFADVDARFAAGSTIHDRYVVQSEIGRGGMGTVYVALDRSLGRDVAIKLHRAGSGGDRLQREAVAMAKLAHPNVVNVFEIASVDDRMFVAMEYVRGTTLRGWLDASSRSWRQIVAMLVEAGRGLAAAHDAGLVHRDFKPENVLVGEDGRPRVGDFGLARTDHAPAAIDPELAATAATMTGGLVGTPAYMAPEQLCGEAIDARCDQFAFCVVAWECLFGKRPFAGANLAALQVSIERHDLDKPASDVPDRVRRVIERGLEIDPSARYDTMPSLLVALQRAAAPRTTRNAIATALSAIVIGAGAFATYQAVAARQQAAACVAEREQVRSLFAEPVRAAMHRDFLATGTATAPSAETHASFVLDRYTTALADQTIAVCRDHDDTPRILAARHACLTQRTSELESLIDAFVHADADLVKHAPDAAWAAFDPIPCSDDSVLSAATMSREHHEQLGRVMASGRTGHYREGIALAEPLLAEARATKDQGLELEVLMELGQEQTEIDRKAALVTYHDALALAEAQGRDLLAAVAHDSLANDFGTEQSDYTQAHREIELARAKLARIGGNPGAEGRLLMTEAQVLFNENRQGDAEAAMRHAIAIFEKQYGTDHPNVGAAYGTLSQILGSQAQYPAALEAAQHALTVLSNALGDHHPTVAGAEMTVAQELIAGRQFAKATELLRRADAVFLEFYGADHPSRAAIYGNIGQLEQDQQHWDASLVAFRTAKDILERIDGPTAPSIAGVERDIANSLGGAGRFDEALVEAQRAVAIIENLGPDGESRLANTLSVVAETQIARDHPELALPIAERALAIATNRTADANPLDVTDAQYLVARSLWATHGDRARMHALLEAAGKTSDPDKHAQVAAWVQAHP